MSLFVGSNAGETITPGLVSPTVKVIGHPKAPSNAADIILAGSGNDVVYGQNGTDFLYGGTGDDRLSGGAGIDGVRGGAGNDVLIGGQGNDVLRGDAGSDVFRWELADQGTAVVAATHDAEFAAALADRTVSL